MISIDFSSEKPIYTQLFEQFVLAFARGECPVDSSLPPVRALAAELGVNMHTVNKAYHLLRDAGYVKIDRRHGAIVNPPRTEPAASGLEEWRADIELLVAQSYLQGIPQEQVVKNVIEHYQTFGGVQR